MAQRKSWRLRGTPGMTSAPARFTSGNILSIEHLETTGYEKDWNDERGEHEARPYS